MVKKFGLPFFEELNKGFSGLKNFYNEGRNVRFPNENAAKLKDLDHKILLINKNDPDYLDMLYRQKFKYVTEDEIIIKLK